MNLKSKRSRVFSLIWALSAIVLLGLPSAKCQTQNQLQVVIIDDSLNITADPAVLQAAGQIRLPEIAVPATPALDLIGLTTENPALIVQRQALGRAWYELTVETDVLNGLLELHGLAADQRSRMLRWERDEVRAGCYRRLLEIVNKSNRSEVEQRIFDSTAVLVKTMKVDAAKESLRQYNKWFFAPHLFVPPPPFKYERPPPANAGVFSLFGGPKPPSFEEFKQYGVAVVYGGAGGNGEFERVMAATAARSATVGAAVLSSGLLGLAAGVALAAALPLVITTLVVKVVIPFAARVVSQGIASAAGVIGGTVIGAVVFVVVTGVFEGIAVVEADQLPGKLAEAVTNAENTPVDLNQYLTTEAGIAQIYSAFIRSTLPDFPATEAAPVALPTDQQWLTAAVDTPWYRPTPALQMQALDTRQISVRLVDGWFVYPDENGREKMTLNLEFLGPDGQPQVLTKLASGFFLLSDGTGNANTASKVSEFNYRNWRNQSRKAKLGSAGVQAVLTPSGLADGAVGVPYSQALSVTSPGTGAYAFSLVTEGLALPPGLTLSSAGVLSGTPSAAGDFVFDVFATNGSTGTHPVVQRVTVRIIGDPAPSPANLLYSWLLEDNPFDTVGGTIGVWSGTASYAAGLVGRAASFNGTNALELPRNIFPPGAISFETWFRTTGQGVILGQSGVTTGSVPAIYVDVNGKLKVSFFWSGSRTPVTSTAVVNNDVWHHVAVTHNGTTQRVYLDGTQISAVNFTQVSYDTSYRYFLGFGNTALWPEANNGFFTGRIDEAAIYGRALTASEVQSIYVAGPAGKMNLTIGNVTPMGTVNSYRSETITILRNGSAIPGLNAVRVMSGTLPHGLTLNESTGTISGTPRSAQPYTFRLRATDVSGHSGDQTFTVTISGPPRPQPDGIIHWWQGEGDSANRINPQKPLIWQPFGAPTYAPALVGQGFGLSSIESELPPFGVLFSTGSTFETWFQTTFESVIIAKPGSPASAPVLWIGRDGFVRADLSGNTIPAQSTPMTSKVRVDDGGWHHVALTYAYNTSEQRLYVDGELVGVSKGAVNFSTFRLALAQVVTPGWPGLPDGTNVARGLTIPMLDEVTMYKRALETSEVNGIFAAGALGKPSLRVNEGTLPVVRAGIPYRQALSPAGATGAVTWKIIGGSLPPGLRLSTDGVISGVLTSTRSTAVSIQVTDSTGAIGVRDYVIKAAGTPAPLPFGAVGWWRGELNTKDSVGTRNGVPLSGGPGYRTGNGGSAFLFNRDGSSLLLPSGSFPSINFVAGSNTPYSFETWFLTDRPGVILGRRDFAYPSSPVVFKPAMYVGTDGLLRAPMYEVDRTATAPTSAQRVDDGKFHHAAVTYDGSTLTLYLDGVAQTPVVTNATSRYASLVDNVELGTGYTAGPWPATTGGWMSFYGYIDEPTTYNRSLAGDEIRSIYAAGEIGKADAGVVNVTLPAGRVDASYLEAGYSGSEATVTFGAGELPPGLTISSSGIVSGIPTSAGTYQFQAGVLQADGTWVTYQYSLTIAGAPASALALTNWYSGDGNTGGHVAGEVARAPFGVGYGPGRIGQAFSFDGVSQYLAISNVPFPAPDGEWSFETWFQTTSGGVILGQDNGAGGYVPMLYVGADGRLYCDPYWSGSIAVLASPSRVDDGIFHHAIFTYANGERKLYLDGVLVDSASAPGVDYGISYFYKIGGGFVAGWPSAPASRFFLGLIDEPHFYSRALRPLEARRGFSAGKLGRSAVMLDDTLPDVIAGTVPYAGAITASGGVKPYTFALTEGRLPVGFTLGADGQITGPVTYSSGTFDFAVTATSATGERSVRDYQISVDPNYRYRPAGVKAWWQADGNAADWANSAYNSNPFSNAPGNPFVYSEGISGQAFTFRGLGVYQTFGIYFPYEAVNLPATAFPSEGKLEDFSIEFWFRATQPGGLLGQSNLPVLGLDYVRPMVYIDTEGRLRAQLGLTRTPNQVVSPNSVLDDTWHHFVGTLNPGGEMKIYLDGGLIGTKSGIGPVCGESRAFYYLGYVVAVDWPLSGDSGFGVTFSGRIDEAATWTRVLTQEEVLRLFACGPNAKAKATIQPSGTLPTATSKTPYSQPLTVAGQTAALFTVTKGTLPPGLSVSAPNAQTPPPITGLYGTPTTTGAWEFTLRNVPPDGPLESQEVVDEIFRIVVDPLTFFRGTYTMLVKGSANSTGLLRLVLGANGSYTGTVTIGAITYPFRGVFAADGTSAPVAVKGSIFVLALTLDPLTGEITGALTSPGETVPVSGSRPTFSTKNPAPQVGKYTLLLQPDPAATGAEYPQGTGYGTATVNAAGLVRFAGALPNGTAITQAVPLTPTGDWNFFTVPPGLKGSVAGALSFSKLDNTVGGSLAWTKPQNTKAKLFPAAFDTTLSVAGSPYVTPKKGVAVLPGLTAGTVTLEDGNLASSITKAFTLGANNKITLTAPGTDKLTLSINLLNGLTTGTFFDTTAKKPRTLKGVILQVQAVGGGQFTGTTQTGSFTLGP